jgi:tRNA (guanine37-N1)-methyltransferase
VTRLLPGSLGNEASSQNESFSADVDSEGSLARNISRPEAAKIPIREGGVWDTQTLLDFPHYTRPAAYRGWRVPDVLIGGNHAEVAAWRREAASEKTKRNRPDLCT